MSFLSEEEVYLGTKKTLLSKDFIIIASQPPRGIDHYPVVEISSDKIGIKGSKDSFKPDFIAFKKDIFYIVECKSSYSSSDYSKLINILNDENRISSLYNNLKQRNLFYKLKYNEDVNKFSSSLKGVLAYAGKHHHQPKVAHIIVDSFASTGQFIDSMHD